MLERRSLKFPILLGSTMILLLTGLIVGWVLMTVFAALREAERAPLYWALLTIGSTVFAIIIVGVVLYLVLSIKSINLNRRQSNFIDSVTHELKSPIASLKLCLQTLKRQTVDEQEREAFLKFMMDDVERLDDLISHLLNAGHTQRPPVDDETEEVDLPELLSECVQTVCMRYRVEPSIIELEAEPCVVQNRRVDLMVVFRNLIDNAVKYAGSPPEVQVKVNPSADQVQVEIRDNGRGVPKKERNRIFGRFVRLGLEVGARQTGYRFGAIDRADACTTNARADHGQGSRGRRRNDFRGDLSSVVANAIFEGSTAGINGLTLFGKIDVYLLECLLGRRSRSSAPTRMTLAF